MKGDTQVMKGDTQMKGDTPSDTSARNVPESSARNVLIRLLF